jgi:hypothetical protein
MISWRSFTTSKVLPTFVGVNGGSGASSYSVEQRFDTWSSSYNQSKTVSESNGFTSETIIDKNSYITNGNIPNNGTPEQLPGTTIISPPQKVRQETTSIETYESFYTSTKRASESIDNENNTIPFFSYVWTTNKNGENVSFEQVTTDATSIVTEQKTRRGSRTKVTTTGAEIEFVTYTANDGNVVVVDHTIIEQNSGIHFATFNDFESSQAVTALEFSPTRITLSFSENYVSTLPVRDSSITSTESTSVPFFSVSGSLTKSERATLPDFAYNIFPWSVSGERVGTLFQTNDAWTLVTSSSQLITFENTWNTQTQTIVDMGVNGTYTYKSGRAKTGEFYRKQFALVGDAGTRNNSTLVRASEPDGVLDLNLTFDTKNTLSSLGLMVEGNYEYQWEEDFAGRGFPNITVAIPLEPIFTRTLSSSNNAPIPETSKHTTITGSRQGGSYTTAAGWQEVSADRTIKTTTSGSFSLKTTSSRPVGVFQRSNNDDFGFRGFEAVGGFMTPNALHTIVFSPGLIFQTTFDASTSGTLSSFYETGTSQTFSDSGPVPITLFSRMRFVKGYGLYTQRLLDNGLL